MRKSFKKIATDIATVDDRVTMIFGDISVFLFREFQNKFPDRFYNIGICENTLISIAAGLRSQGFIPFVHTIAPFITERCIEQIKLDLCYNQFGCNIISCGATFDYAWDGATHHCWLDLATLKLLPNTQVFQPGSIEEFKTLLTNEYASDKVNYFRLSDHSHNIKLPEEIRAGEGIVLKDTGSDKTIITAGPILKNVYEACSELKVNILYFHTIKPFDHKLIKQYANTDLLVIHDSHGLFESVCENASKKVRKLTLPDSFCSSYGTVEDAQKYAGLDTESIYNFITTAFK